jgi:methyl-accepting chemotaxis protein
MSREQAMGIERVTSSVSEMDKVTQQNAASAEQSSSAASELNAQAGELATMVAGFKLERTAPAPAPRAPAAPAPAPRKLAPPAPAPARNGKAASGKHHAAFPMDDDLGPIRDF